MNIYLLRHGQTQDNAEGRYASCSDTPLNELGRTQLRCVADWLRGIAFDRVYSSPSRRALESAQIVIPGAEPCTDDRLAERRYGIFEGLTYEQIKKQYAEALAGWENNWMHYEVPQGESYMTFYMRVAAFWEDLLRLDTENVLLSTHGGVICASYCFIMGDASLFWKFSSGNADLSLARYEHRNLYLRYIQPCTLE
ncbi:MAG: histidine phosphatase family protein [Bacillota bacterium]|nr:histidine phosphatase family protein [Bacillota bacterium]